MRAAVLWALSLAVWTSVAPGASVATGVETYPLAQTDLVPPENAIWTRDHHEDRANAPVLAEQCPVAGGFAGSAKIRGRARDSLRA